MHANEEEEESQLQRKSQCQAAKSGFVNYRNCLTFYKDTVLLPQKHQDSSITRKPMLEDVYTYSLPENYLEQRWHT